MNSKLRYYFICLVAISGLLFSCSEEPDSYLDTSTKGKGVFVVNEGNFTFSNSSLSFYDPESKKILNDVFYSASGFPIGDALQSMTIIDSAGYLCVSNSGKVLVFSINTFKHLATIGGLGAPRNIVQLEKNKAYISDLWNPYLTIINPETNTVTGKVELGSSSENMIESNGLVFISSWSYNNKIFVVDPENDRLIDSIEVIKQPNSMVIDRDSKLWVLSDGGYKGSPYGQDTAGLIRIDPVSRKIERKLNFGNPDYSPGNLSINPSGDSLYFINGSIFRMGIYDEAIPVVAIIESSARNFYSLGIDPASGEIYVGDSKDFLSTGQIYRYSSRIIPLDTFTAGIIPGSYCFK